jgi:hypothetical protein
MQTPKLLIVAIRGVHGIDEVDIGAKGMFDKYSSRTLPNGSKQQVALVYLSRSGNEVEKEKCLGKLELSDGDTLGVYIVAHSGDMNTAIYDHDLVANIKRKFLDKKDTQYKLDKVCLAVCTGAKDAEETLCESHQGVLIAKFAELLARHNLRPRLAGWTGFVTADQTGKKRILSSTNLKNDYVSNLTKSRSIQKLVYVYDNEKGYVRKALSDWTDKT